jgi:hypothetical protein
VHADVGCEDGASLLAVASLARSPPQ